MPAISFSCSIVLAKNESRHPCLVSNLRYKLIKLCGFSSWDCQYSVLLINVQVLTKLVFPRSTSLGYSVFNIFVHCWIQFVTFFVKFFLQVYSYWSAVLGFFWGGLFVFVILLSDFAIKAIWPNKISWNEIHLPLFFWKRLYRIGANYFLNGS